MSRQNIFMPFLSIILFAVLGCSQAPESGGSGSSSVSSASLLEIIYVSTNGSDSNIGSNKTLPILSIQKAVNVAANNAVIYIACGNYLPGKGLNNNGTNGVILSGKSRRSQGDGTKDLTAKPVQPA